MFLDILNFSKEISDRAGDILLSGFRSETTVVSYKSRTDLVTNMDKASEKFLYDSISLRFPDHTIIAEEGSRKETEGEFIWYVDPLDATNNYAHGIPFFCVSIGVYSRESKSVICGVVFDPIHREMFSASAGEGAFLNGERIRVSETDDLGISILATGFPYTKEDMEKNNLTQFNAFLPHVQGVRRMGSAALDLCYLACGRVDGYWEPSLKPWDMAAGSIIVREAGGIITGYRGEDFYPEIPGIAASNRKIHGIMLEKLADTFV